MPLIQVFEQSIQINASASEVERCIADRTLMHQWFNPALRCEPVGDWSTDVGSRKRKHASPPTTPQTPGRGAYQRFR